MFHLGVLFDALKNVPPPVLVCFVAGDVVEIPKALNGLRPEEIVGVGWLSVKVVTPSTRLLVVEMANFWCQVGWLAREGEVAGISQLLGHSQQGVGRLAKFPSIRIDIDW